MQVPLFIGLAASLALFAPSAWAQARAEHELSLGMGNLRYISFNRSSESITTLEAAYFQRLGGEGLGRGLRLGGGLRTGWPIANTNFPLEAFVQGQLLARWGFFEAGVSAELGLTGFAKLFKPPFVLPVELNAQEDSRMSPVYVSFVAAPVRLHFGPVVVSALELGLGTGVPFFGQSVRLHLGLVRIGAVL